ncbi:hypothetical protein [Streptomyces wedmorensis]|uniref:hypothetical protein n=1 Tax=Streptomyces wedmorensis TaxID=43759 RepID=UPI00378D1941
MPLSHRIEESFERRLRPLPEPPRTLLLITAIEATGDAALVWAAADRMGVSTDALAAAGLTATDGTVRFHQFAQAGLARSPTASGCGRSCPQGG